MARLISASLAVAAAAEPDFDAWAKAHLKRYGGKSELQHRRQVFEQNARLVAQYNAEEDDVVYAVDGPFADLTPEEFRTKVLMPSRPAPSALDAAREHAAPSADPIPIAFDWTSQGVVTQVRDQGTLGTCWAFSTAQNLEGQHALATGQLVELSPQQLSECDASTDDTCNDDPHAHGCADCGMFGGWPYLAYQYLQQAGGLYSEEDFPYWHDGVYSCMAEGYSKKLCGNHDEMYCNASSTKGQGPNGLCKKGSGFATKVTGWKALSTDEDELAAQLVQYGPLSVALNANRLQAYKKGIWQGGLWGCKVDPDEGILGLDHAVLLVGYGVDGGKPYWKVKNSWGKKWGEEGYFRILRGSGTCGINTSATTGMVERSAAVV